jgi:hypothetical protein
VGQNVRFFYKRESVGQNVRFFYKRESVGQNVRFFYKRESVGQNVKNQESQKTTCPLKFCPVETYLRLISHL